MQRDLIEERRPESNIAGALDDTFGFGLVIIYMSLRIKKTTIRVKEIFGKQIRN